MRISDWSSDVCSSDLSADHIYRPTSLECGASALRFQDAAADLVGLDGVEQRLEVALAEALVALALDDLEEHRADDVLGEDLQQAATAFGRRAVDQDLVGGETAKILAVARQPPIDLLVVGVRHTLLERDPAGLPRFQDRKSTRLNSSH